MISSLAEFTILKELLDYTDKLSSNYIPVGLVENRRHSVWPWTRVVLHQEYNFIYLGRLRGGGQEVIKLVVHYWSNESQHITRKGGARTRKEISIKGNKQIFDQMWIRNSASIRVHYIMN